MDGQIGETFVVEVISGGVLWLKLERAPAHALSLGMIEALDAALDRAARNDDARVVILHGAGRIFCAGHDLKEISHHRQDADDGRAYLEELFAKCAEMMQRLAGMPQPTIAVLDGMATAGGLQLMASCDLAFAGENARFCLPGVSNGGFCTTPAVAVSRKVSHGHLMELALSGETFDAKWALRTGLVNRVYPSAMLEEEAQGFAEVLASRHAPAIARGKATTNAQLPLPLQEAYAAATPVMVEHFMDPHRIEQDRRSRF